MYWNYVMLLNGLAGMITAKAVKSWLMVIESTYAAYVWMQRFSYYHVHWDLNIDLYTTFTPLLLTQYLNLYHLWPGIHGFLWFLL